MADISPEQRRLHGESNLDEFFRTVEPELKAHVISLPLRISKMNVRREIKQKEVLSTADRIMDHVRTSPHAGWAADIAVMFRCPSRIL
jgi:hypothetical protein